ASRSRAQGRRPGCIARGDQPEGKRFGPDTAGGTGTTTRRGAVQSTDAFDHETPPRIYIARKTANAGSGRPGSRQRRRFRHQNVSRVNHVGNERRERPGTGAVRRQMAETILGESIYEAGSSSNFLTTVST